MAITFYPDALSRSGDSSADRTDIGGRVDIQNSSGQPIAITFERPGSDRMAGTIAAVEDVIVAESEGPGAGGSTRTLRPGESTSGHLSGVLEPCAGKSARTSSVPAGRYLVAAVIIVQRPRSDGEPLELMSRTVPLELGE